MIRSVEGTGAGAAAVGLAQRAVVGVGLALLEEQGVRVTIATEWKGAADATSCTREATSRRMRGGALDAKASSCMCAP